jgi:hypothetical protein
MLNYNLPCSAYLLLPPNDLREPDEKERLLPLLRFDELLRPKPPEPTGLLLLRVLKLRREEVGLLIEDLPKRPEELPKRLEPLADLLLPRA